MGPACSFPSLGGPLDRARDRIATILLHVADAVIEPLDATHAGPNVEGVAPHL